MDQEFDYIRWLRQQIPPAFGVRIGLGDDCALLEGSSAGWLLTTDTLTEGVDFLLQSATAFQIGYKAMAVNLSDIAAMAGQPRFALVSVVTRPELGTSFLHELYRGLQSAAAPFQVSIVGGDTNSWPQGLVVSVTLIGQETSRGVVRRNGAKVGDAIFVTGPCGGSLLGRHLRPQPRIAEALALHQDYPLTALIDISDGLAADLGHILEESGVGAELLAADVPIHADAVTRAATTGRTALDHALNDGEDFELILTLPEAEAERLSHDPKFGYCRRMGQIIPAGYLLIDSRGRHPLTPRGWQHRIN